MRNDSNKGQRRRFCILHFPGKKSSEVFQKAIDTKLKEKDFNFRGIWFPDDVSVFDKFSFDREADFSHSTFNGKVSFYATIFAKSVEFVGVTFKGEADFDATDFNESVDFSNASFERGASFAARFQGEAKFFSCTFHEFAEFFSAEFMGSVNMIGAEFASNADFTRSTFDADTDFTSARFADSLRFVRQDMGRQVFGEYATLCFDSVRIDHPELVFFYGLTLRPTWFVKVDSRKFVFTDVQWLWSSVNDELQRMRKYYLSGRHHPLLAIAYRHLAINAEENHRYQEASKFRYMSMDVDRHGPWRRFGTIRRWFSCWRLGWWYWVASGYGERVTQAFLVLLAIWFVSVLSYTRVGFANSEPTIASEPAAVAAKHDNIAAPLPFGRALTYSAGVMMLQRPEPKPATTAAQTIVLFETILGPVQAALLALAIRRKFMR